MNGNLKKLKRLLEELFQLDQADLDFGIYRIMNQKRDEISDYLEKKLPEHVKESFSHYKSADKSVLENDLKKAMFGVDTTAIENEVYSHLYNFFKRYYHEGDFLSLRRYKEGVYAIPYEGEEVKLHWANHDQYYIKTSEYFRDYTFKLSSDRRVHFKIINADTEKDNTKAQNGNERRFILCEEEPIKLQDNELFIRFEYRADPDKRKQNVLSEQAVRTVFESLKKNSDWLIALVQKYPTEKNPNRTLLEKHLTDYTARNTFDYFIHKDLGGFLRRELDFFIKNEVMHLDDIENETAPRVEQYLSKIKVIRKIAHKVIAFLEQLENFQKKLWLKKKFVVETNYCVTLDRVPEELYDEIIQNDAQREEWVRLFAINEIEKEIGQPGYSSPLTIEFLKANDKLVLDTAFFNEQFKMEVIKSIENIDDQCNGLLIHSENFQALNLLSNRNKGLIKAIYIDPPYNTGQDEFLYKDNYQCSSWLSLLTDRLSSAKEYLNENGAIAISIDENEISSMLKVMDDIFGKENRAGIATVKRGSVTGHKAINKGLVNIIEYLVIYAKNKTKWNPQRAYKARDRNDRYNNFIKNRNESTAKWSIISLLDAFAEYKGIPKRSLKNTLGNKFEDEIFNFVKNNSNSVIQLAYPDESNVSKDAQVAIKKSRKNKKEIQHFKRDGVPDMYLIGGQRLLFYSDRLVDINGELVTAEPLSDIWDDILPNDLHNEGGVSLKKGKKSENLLNRIYDICCEPADIVFDFFLGSGTTAATALKRGLKFIGVEQGEYFDSKSLVRMKLINKTKKRHENIQSFLFKYIRLESYEDTLNNLQIKRTKKQEQLLLGDIMTEEAKEEYMLSYMLDVETRDSASLLNIDQFEDPFNYKLNISTGSAGETKPTNIDLVETFNYLIGLTVSHIDSIRGFRVVEGTNPDNEKVLIIWRNLKEKSNKDLEEFFDKQEYSTKDMEFDLIYVNGDNNLENLKKDNETWKVRLIEQEFKRLMFDVQDI